MGGLTARRAVRYPSPPSRAGFLAHTYETYWIMLFRATRGVAHWWCRIAAMGKSSGWDVGATVFVSDRSNVSCARG